jgi:hypothetical protein
MFERCMWSRANWEKGTKNHDGSTTTGVTERCVLRKDHLTRCCFSQKEVEVLRWQIRHRKELREKRKTKVTTSEEAV